MHKSVLFERRPVQILADGKMVYIDQSCPVNPAESDKSASDTGSPSHGPELTASLTLLAQAIERQTKAITLLANSNQLLVQAMSQAEADEDDEPRFDLSGKRV